MMSACPSRMWRRASPRAWEPEAQAETTPKLTDLAWNSIATTPEAMFAMREGIVKGETRDGPRSMKDAGLVLDGLHPADAGADDHAEAFGIELGDVDGGVLDGEAGSGDGVLGVAVVTLGLLGVHVLGRIEIADLRADLGREVGGVEAGHAGNPGTPLDEGVPEGRVVMPEGRQRADARDDYPARFAV